MSEDILPPPAPGAAVGKKKKGLFSKLLGKPAVEEPPVDSSSMREKLGLSEDTSKKQSVEDYFESLVQNADVDSDDDAKRYDEEQAQLEVETFDDSPKVDDTLVKASEEDAGIAVPVPDRGDETTSQEVTVDVPKSDDAPVEDIPVDNTKAIESTTSGSAVPDSLLEEETSTEPTKASSSSPKDFAEDSDSKDESPESLWAKDDQPVAPSNESEFTEDIPVESTSTDSSFSEDVDFDNSPKQESEFTEDVSEPVVADTSDSSSMTVDHDSEPFEGPAIASSPELYDEEDKEEPKVDAVKTEQKKSEKPKAKHASHSHKKESKKSSKTVKKEPKKEEPKVVAKPKPTASEVAAAKKKQKEDEKRKLLQSKAEKKFSAYLDKEQKITKDFVKKIDTLNNYIDAEKKQFQSMVSLLGVDDVNAEVEDSLVAQENPNASYVDIKKLEHELLVASEKHESKIKSLYQKKHAAVLEWLEKQVQLFKKTQDKMYGELEAKEVQLKAEREEFKQQKKEYGSLTKKIESAQKRLDKVEERHIFLEKENQKYVSKKSDYTELKKQFDDLQSHYNQLEEKRQLAQQELDQYLKRKADEESHMINERVALKKEKELLENRISLAKEQAKISEKRLSDLQKRVHELSERELKFKKEEHDAKVMLQKREQDILEKIAHNEELLRTISLKEQTILDLEKQVDKGGFENYLQSKLDQINPDAVSVVDEKDDYAGAGTPLHAMMNECKGLVAQNDFTGAKKKYNEVRQAFMTATFTDNEKSMIHSKIKELYDDIRVASIKQTGNDKYKDIL